MVNLAIKYLMIDNATVDGSQATVNEDLDDVTAEQAAEQQRLLLLLLDMEV